MTISSRTPEGFPHKCVLCGNVTHVEFSDPGNDATCPYCGYLIIQSSAILDQFKSFLARTRGISIESIDSSSRLRSIGLDSMETVELVMQLEEEFGISISEDESASIQTVGDAIRILQEKGRSG